jgi:hypothetical protein
MLIHDASCVQLIGGVEPALLVFVRALCVSDISTNRGLTKRKTKTGHTHNKNEKRSTYRVFYYSYVARTGLESRSCFFFQSNCIRGSICMLFVAV